MSHSWGHAVRRLTEPETAALERQNKRGTEIFKREDYDYDITCRMPKCRERATHETRYSYVTGRGGRISRASKNVCAGHAEKFAARHGIEITEPPWKPPRQEAAVKAGED